MMQLFKSLLGESPRAGESPRGYTAKKSTPGAKPKPTHATGDYRAVSIAPNIACAVLAKDVAGKRYLLREAPRLPLAGCATPASCSCKYRKHADRREADRRLLGSNETARWFNGAERRECRVRRAKTN
jgi:hypothetical protein